MLGEDDGAVWPWIENYRLATWFLNKLSVRRREMEGFLLAEGDLERKIWGNKWSRNDPICRGKRENGRE
jgi:hypothetical protein